MQMHYCTQVYIHLNTIMHLQPDIMHSELSGIERTRPSSEISQ